MSLITGTINNANPGLELYNAVAVKLAAEGWVLVDTVVGARTHKIWKSPGGINSFGTDFYVDFCYLASGASSLLMIPMEYYDPATDLAYRMIYSGLFSTAIDAGGSRYGSTGYSLEHANWVVGGGTACLFRLATQVSVAFGYWIQITPDAVVGFTSVEPSTVIYAGLFEPSSIYTDAFGANAFPLVAANIPNGGEATPTASASTTRIALTRFPAGAVLQSQGWGNYGYIRNAWPLSGVTTPNFPGIPSHGVTYMTNGKRYASKLLLFPAASTNPSGNSNPGGAGYMGQLKNVLICSATSGGVVRGDTVTIGGVTWVCATSGGSSDTQNTLLIKG